MDAYVAQQDYRRNATTSSTANYFPATNATYCRASDEACSSCVASKSDFCVGKDGCVCVSICETAQWSIVAEAQLPYAMEAQNEHSSCDLAANVATDTPAPTPPPSQRKHVLAIEDRCTWHTNQTLCGVPRTCYDCLNVPLANGDVRGRPVLCVCLCVVVAVGCRGWTSLTFCIGLT